MNFLSLENSCNVDSALTITERKMFQRKETKSWPLASSDSDCPDHGISSQLPPFGILDQSELGVPFPQKDNDKSAHLASTG